MRRMSSTHMISSVGLSKPASLARLAATPGLSTMTSPRAASALREMFAWRNESS